MQNQDRRENLGEEKFTCNICGASENKGNHKPFSRNSLLIHMGLAHGKGDHKTRMQRSKTSAPKVMAASVGGTVTLAEAIAALEVKRDALSDTIDTLKAMEAR